MSSPWFKYGLGAFVVIIGIFILKPSHKTTTEEETSEEETTASTDSQPSLFSNMIKKSSESISKVFSSSKSESDSASNSNSTVGYVPASEVNPPQPSDYPQVEERDIQPPNPAKRPKMFVDHRARLRDSR